MHTHDHCEQEVPLCGCKASDPLQRKTAHHTALRSGDVVTEHGVLPAEGEPRLRGEGAARPSLTRLHGLPRVRIRALHVLTTGLCALPRFLLPLLTCEN